MLVFYFIMIYGLSPAICALSLNQYDNHQNFPLSKDEFILPQLDDDVSPTSPPSSISTQTLITTTNPSLATSPTTTVNEITAPSSVFTSRNSDPKSDISQPFSTSSSKLPPHPESEIGSTSKLIGFTQNPDAETFKVEMGRSQSSGDGQTDEGVTGTTQMPMMNDQPHPTMSAPEHLQQQKNRTGSAVVPLRGKCNTTEQCSGEFTECRINMCKCELGYVPRADNADLCGKGSNQQSQAPQADPTMIGVVIGLVLMSITLCVVMRLFAKARFQENRTIFNTPNPRLMNVSLLKGSKNLLRGNSGGQRSRRGSQASINSDPAAADGQPAPAGTAPPTGNKTSRGRPHRQPSTDTAPSESSSRPMSSSGGNKPSRTNRQESVASNSNV